LRIAVTGACGSIGQALIPNLVEHDVFATDVDTLDVTDESAVRAAFLGFGPEIVYHLAADKHAPDGEEHPEHTALVNISGTENVLRAAAGAKVIVASTCKAADPETAYGASKLIAERMVLNAGGVVIRYYNVRETSGNVFRLWESIPKTDPIPFTDCRRYFISLDDAIRLTIRAIGLPSGRYTVDPGRSVHMSLEADRLYPTRQLVKVPRRRGDRKIEPLKARTETLVPYEGILRIESPHDPVPA
jgi:FlaA1/EpsC-like NDP-sugar epimerase